MGTKSTWAGTGDPNRNLVHQENVYGTYLHGLFDRPETTRALVRALMRQKGLDPASVQALDMETYKQQPV